MDWSEMVLGGTRGAVVALLRRERRSIGELAAALGISDTAVRVHVAALQRDGLVEPAGAARDTGGKPARLFRITDAAEALYPKAYALVLQQLLTSLESRDGPAAVHALLRDIGARAGAAHHVPLPDGADPADARVAAAADALRALGGDVEVERTGTGWRIRGYACPLAAVVSTHPELCVLAESLVAEISGQAAAERCDRTGRPRCSFVLGTAAPER